ncbi:hypothetical protein LX15_005018 [Streptoalloteichus tenebrarius]|uniref:Uncharacterized protein n=1 Tax=Streptoalloteichus tenebrarius (strain ATCC 17920 / DSM 40477 / JCM 4838 / CBS 697.72 / NBRC 16177 / NCIMB 11028 / NRRL B-12390 / A12253. 1 / ISP 5477) TaxID=1933 RepID=A0ABT1I0H5_STRSD|nr:hypothetical protein [Streptoalloteichus tenebrarius]MCP2261297.1 hypothetical protein [Streptoalloteichus tenebrarius]BFF03695.1 hypothetical protein GCM10020241_53700 [Streptoalloteichus tenebrarius]
MTEGFASAPASINHNANILVEIAGYLEAGRPDVELATLAKAPRSHPDVGGLVERFTAFAFDQFQDAVALLGALATKLGETGREHASVDEGVQRAMDGFLIETTLVPPDQR